MYREFYGLRNSPFELTSNPNVLFMTVQHREALSSLQFGVQARKGLTLLVGEAGTGKTTLIRALLKGIESVGAYFSYINNPRLTRQEFFESVATGFHLSDGATASKAVLLRDLEHALKARADEGRLTALVVDEAQSLSDDLLEEVRLLANIETDSIKLLPVVLAGHPELADRMNQPALRQLKQRVSTRCDLHSLTLDETASYIVHRICSAGGDGARVFTREAVTLIHERSGGIPRVINTLCDNALIAGFADGCRPVTRAIVLEVCANIDLPGTHAGNRIPDSPPAPVVPALAPAFATVSMPTPSTDVPRAARGRIFGLF